MASSSVFTRRTGHPYQAKSLVDLPDRLRELAEQSLVSDDPVHTIFVVPPQTVPKRLSGRGGMRSVPEQALLFTTRGALHIQGAKPHEQPPKVTFIRGEDLLYAHLIIVILYGRLELCGVADDVLTRIVVEYNTVSHNLVQPGLRNFLHLACTPVPSEKSAVGNTGIFLRELERQSSKFRNGLENYALQPGEQLLGYVFQPRILKHYWRVYQRLIMPASLLALTDRKLILIEEGRTNTKSYGWFFTFCPRINITGVVFRPNDVWQDVQVHLAKGLLSVDRRMTLENSTAQAWQALWESHTQ